MNVAFLFPGQGSQRPAMLHELPATAAVSATLAEAAQSVAVEIESLDAPATLASTVATQLALLIAGVAAARALAASGARPELVAGHSVGAFAAAVTANVLDFADALRLVALRARLMEQAYPSGYGMAVIVGLPERRLRSLLAELSTGDEPVFAANVNAPLQVAIAGADAALDRAIARARGAGARRGERLAVPVPSHCRLMAPVADALGAALAEVELRPPSVSYVGNRRARVLRTAEAVRDDLANGVAGPVRWHDATTVLFELGARLFVEMPPGNVLTRLATAAFPEARAVAMSDAGLDSAAALITRARGGSRRA